VPETLDHRGHGLCVLGRRGQSVCWLGGGGKVDVPTSSKSEIPEKF